MKQYRVAILGAGGLIGQELVKILEQRNFPISDIHLYTTDHITGKKLFFRHRELAITEANNESFAGMEIAFFLSDVHGSRHYLNHALRAGALVIDNTDAWRLEHEVPCIVPEVNADDIQGHRGVVTSPTATTVPLVVALNPLHRLNPIKRIISVALISVSESGLVAMEELSRQSHHILDNQKAVMQVFPHQMAFNLLPEVDLFLDTGYTREERKLVEESRKILHAPDVEGTATCIRVPIFRGTGLAVHIEFTHPFPPDEARQVLMRSPGIKVLDDTTINLYPQPWTATGADECFVGRIRKDSGFKTGLALWITVDNIRKGSALNIVQIAEETIKRGWLTPGG